MRKRPKIAGGGRDQRAPSARGQQARRGEMADLLAGEVEPDGAPSIEDVRPRRIELRPRREFLSERTHVIQRDMAPGARDHQPPIQIEARRERHRGP
jgi:hypothetical protein